MHGPAAFSKGGRVVKVGAGLPLSRLLVAAGLAVEVLALVAYAASVVVVALRGEAADRLGAGVLGLTIVALAAGLAVVAVGVARARPWARSPTLVWQLLQLAVAVPAVRALPQVAVPAILLAVAVGAGVLLPGVLVPDR
jgi:hypothetical protein